MDDAFSVERDDGVAVVRIARPPVNALGFEAWAAFRDLLRGLGEDRDVRAVVLTGAPGKHFSAGNDTREFGTATREELVAGTAATRDAFRAVRELPQPVVAAVHGAAMGSGFVLAACCDLRVATPDAKLALPEVRVGSFAGYTFARGVLPEGEARRLVLTGATMRGERAHQVGFVQELASDGEAVLARARELAAEMATFLTGRLGETKAVMGRIAAGEAALWDAYALERDLNLRVMGRG